MKPQFNGKKLFQEETEKLYPYSIYWKLNKQRFGKQLFPFSS